MQTRTYGELFPLDSQWDLLEWKSRVSHLSPSSPIDAGYCDACDPEMGFECTRPMGHDSYHVAHGGCGRHEPEDGDGVYAVWDESGIYRRSPD